MRRHRLLHLALLVTLTATAGSATAARRGDQTDQRWSHTDPLSASPGRGSKAWWPVRMTTNGRAAPFHPFGDTTTGRVFRGAVPTQLTDRYDIARSFIAGFHAPKTITTVIRNRSSKKIVAAVVADKTGTRLVRRGQPDVRFDYEDQAIHAFFADQPGFDAAVAEAATQTATLSETFQTPAYWGPGHGGYSTSYQGSLRRSGSALLYRAPEGRRDRAVKLTDALGAGEHTLELRVGDVIGTQGGQPYAYRDFGRPRAYAGTRGNGEAIPALTLFKPDRAGTTRLELILPGGEAQVLNLVAK